MTRWWKSPIYALWLIDARRKHRMISAYLPVGAKVLEVGSGMGSVVQHLRQCELDVTALDVQDHSVREDLRPVIYDGEHMPFDNKTFDVALILTVLHHARQPDQVLKEAARVAQRVIVIEDIYSNRLQQLLTHWVDSVVNWEFIGHPHNNRTDQHWRRSFSALGMTLVKALSERFMLLFRQSVYVLDTQADPISGQTPAIALETSH